MHRRLQPPAHALSFPHSLLLTRSMSSFFGPARATTRGVMRTGVRRAAAGRRAAEEEGLAERSIVLSEKERWRGSFCFACVG